MNGRHTIDDLQNVCYLDTLLTHYSVLVNQNAVNDTVVDGVAIALPDLFVGPNIVVHGLDGILVPGELSLDEVARNLDHEFRNDLSPQASIESGFASPTMSPASIDSPVMTPMSSESPAMTPMRSPRKEPESVVSPRSSPSPRRSESRSKNSKRKNREKVARSKERRRHGRNGHDRHVRFSKFIDHHRSDF